jgi:hypothetical protein
MPKPSYSVIRVDLAELSAQGQLFKMIGSNVEFTRVDATIQVGFGDASSDLIEISKPQVRELCVPLDGLFIKSSAPSGIVEIVISDEMALTVFSGGGSESAQIRRIMHVQPGDNAGDATIRAAQAFGPNQQDGNASLMGPFAQVVNGGKVGTFQHPTLGYGFNVEAPTQISDHVNARIQFGNFSLPAPSYLDVGADLAGGMAQHFRLGATLHPVMVDATDPTFPAAAVFGVGFLSSEATQTEPMQGHFVGFRGSKDNANWEGYVQSFNGGAEVVRARLDLGVLWDGLSNDLEMRMGYDGSNSFVEFFINGISRGKIAQLAAELSPQTGIGWSPTLGAHKKAQTDSMTILAGHRFGIYIDHVIGG